MKHDGNGNDLMGVTNMMGPVKMGFRSRCLDGFHFHECMESFAWCGMAWYAVGRELSCLVCALNSVHSVTSTAFIDCDRSSVVGWMTDVGRGESRVNPSMIH
jgi:hypothetical protein